MKQTTKSVIDQQFSEFLVSAKSKTEPINFPAYEKDVKRIFKSSLCFTCYASNALPIEIRSFAGILNEGALCLNHLFFEGFFSSGFVLLRSLIETTLKVFYFSTHPVEMNWTLNRVGYREVNYPFLIEYLAKTDDYNLFSPETKLIDRLNNEYSVLSRYVHCHNNGYSKFSLCKKSIAYKDTYLQASQASHEVFSLLFLILGIGFKTGWANLTPAEKSLSLLALKDKDKAEFLKICEI